MVKQNRKFIFLLLFIFSTTQVNCQFSNQFKFSVNDTGVFKLFLSPEVLTKLNYQFGDIQIKNEAGELVPFVFRKDFREDLDYFEIGKIINKGYRNNIFEFIIEIQQDLTLSQIDFKLEDGEYLAKCNLYGSESLSSDFVLLKAGSIIHGYKEDGIYKQLNQIDFSESKFKYYKVELNGINNIKEISLKPIKQRYTHAALNYYPARILKDSINKENLSIIDYEIDMPLTVSGFYIELNSSDFYRRNFTFYNWVSSTKTEKGIQDFYDPILKGTLIAFDSNKFNSRNFKTHKGRIIIENKNDKPIPVKYLIFFEYRYYLLIKIKEKGEYVFEYGNPTASLPEFDFQFIADNYINAKEIVDFYDFKDELVSTNKTDNKDEKGNYYLIILVVVIGIVLIAFSIKLLNNK